MQAIPERMNPRRFFPLERGGKQFRRVFTFRQARAAWLKTKCSPCHTIRPVVKIRRAHHQDNILSGYQNPLDE